MPKSPVATKTPRLRTSLEKGGSVNHDGAAELALKAHVLASDPEILADMTGGDGTMREIADTVNLTEAPQDAVCGLVIDLLQYCEREKIDWTQDVMPRAWEHLRREGAHEAQKR